MTTHYTPRMRALKRIASSLARHQPIRREEGIPPARSLLLLLQAAHDLEMSQATFYRQSRLLANQQGAL